MASALDVAAYILTKRGALTHMKLQKLLYYCQAWSLVWEEKPLYKEKIEAWANGPVVPSLFVKLHAKYLVEAADLHPKGNPARLSKMEKETVDRVVEFYGDKNSQWLSDLTHMELPWQEARIGVPPGVRCSNEVTLASMAQYYGSI